MWDIQLRNRSPMRQVAVFPTNPSPKGFSRRWPTNRSTS